MASKLAKPRSASDYTVACICPMGIELAPVEAMLDEIHQPVPLARDQNAYTLGRIGEHDIVVAAMPETGNNAATMVATQLQNDFPSVCFTLLVGIGGGVPGDVDVRLGDVVVSQPTNSFGGVVQYDLGKRLDGGRFVRTGLLNKPPQVISANVRKLESRHRRQGNQLQQLLTDMLGRYPLMRDEYAFPAAARDDLFEKSYLHVSGVSCDSCDRSFTIDRPRRASPDPRIHYGTVGSANIVVKDAILRDELQQDMNLICVEMEAAGITSSFPCLVIRGICDYADSHKNKQWQPYAAAVAAAYMKELLIHIPDLGTRPKYDTDTNPVIRDPESRNKYFNIPHPLSPMFTGQEDTRRYLDTALAVDRTTRPPVQRRFVLYGLGGSGKTQICLWFAQTHRQRYHGVFWIDATSIGSIQQSFAQIALLLHLEVDIDRVRQELTDVHWPWLLVFDNADDPRISLARYFPVGDRGDIIVTTRNPNCVLYRTVGSQQLGCMLDTDSLSLLLKITHNDSSISESDRQRGKDIVANVGHLPLAVTQAGAYIREISCSFDHYLELYRRRRRDLLQHSSLHHGTDYRHTVFTTWQVSVDQIELMQTEVSKFALQILLLFCFYHHDHIPLAIFEYAWQQCQQEFMPVAELNFWPETVSDIFDLRHIIQESVALLASFSLASRDSSAIMSLSLHPLVHDWCQARLSQFEQQISRRRAIALIATSTQVTNESAEFYQYRHSLTAHIQACFNTHSTLRIQLDDDSSAYQLQNLASIMCQFGYYHDASELTAQVLESFKTRYGGDDIAIFPSMYFLGVLRGRAGRSHEALQLLKQAAELSTKLQGNDHPDTFRAMHGMAIHYAAVGRLDKAVQLAEQVLELRQKKQGVDHPDTFWAMQTLASQYSMTGRPDEALQLMERVVKFRNKTEGSNHPDTIMASHDLSILYFIAGYRDEALQLMEHVVNVYKAERGSDTPHTIMAIHDLAIQYSESGRRDEALGLLKQAVQFYQTRYGVDHPQTNRALHNLALQYGNAGQIDEARRLMEQVVQSFENQLGSNHPSTLQAMQSLRELKDETAGGPKETPIHEPEATSSGV